MLCLIVAVFGAAALAEKEVYIVFGTNSPIAGFYEQIDDSGKIFQQLGGPDDKGYFTYLYNLPNNPEAWHVGIGKNEERILPFYSASGGNDEPPIKNWKSNKGEVQVFNVKKMPSVVSTLMQMEANEGSVTVDGGVGLPKFPQNANLQAGTLYCGFKMA